MFCHMPPTEDPGRVPLPGTEPGTLWFVGRHPIHRVAPVSIVWLLFIGSSFTEYQVSTYCAVMCQSLVGAAGPVVSKTDPGSAFMELAVWWGRRLVKEATVVRVSLGQLTMGCISANGNCMDVMVTSGV